MNNFPKKLSAKISVMFLVLGLISLSSKAALADSIMAATMSAEASAELNELNTQEASDAAMEADEGDVAAGWTTVESDEGTRADASVELAAKPTQLAQK